MSSNSKSLYNSAYPNQPFTLYVEAHTPNDDDGLVTGIARITAAASSFSGYSGRYLQLYIDDELVEQVAVSSLGAYQSVEISGEQYCSDGSVDIDAVWTGSKSTYCPEGGTVTVTKTVSTNYTSSLSLGSSNITLGDNLGITISGKSGNTHTIQGSIGNSGWKTLASGLSTGSHSISIPISLFEPSMSAMASGTMTIRCTTDSVGSTSKTLTAKVPDSYVPKITLNDVIYHNSVNDYLIAQQSSFDIDYEATLEPYGNSASISSIAVTKAQYIPASIGTPSLTVDYTNHLVKSSVLPASVGVSNYKMFVTITVTDSRGRKASLNVSEEQIGTIYGYIPPAISNFEIFRCTSSGDQTPSGQYAYVSVDIDSTTAITICKVNINNVDYNLTKNGTYYEAITGNNALEKGTQYQATLTVQNQMMAGFGDVIQQVAILPTMQMPISFYDDGEQMGVSIGEMARRYDDCEDDASVFNLSSTAIVRATSPSGTVTKKTGYELLNPGCPFPVGYIYMSVDSTSPETLWPGTSWSQIQNTFLLAAGSSYAAGSTGGSATVTLTKEQMPSHSHSHSLGTNTTGSHRHAMDGKTSYASGSIDKSWSSVAAEGAKCDWDEENHTDYKGDHSHSITGSISDTGGGKAHNNMPPYLAVYMWKRVEN